MTAALMSRAMVLDRSGTAPQAGQPICGLADLRRDRGARNHLAGLAAEEIVARDYLRRGLVPLARRWRGGGGEIDLVVQSGRELVFVEVKRGRSFDTAAASLRPRQVGRLCNAASAYLGHQPEGQLTMMRFDLALVNGAGRVQVIENAFMAA